MIAHMSNLLLSRLTEDNPRLGADCTSTLQEPDLRPAELMIQPICELVTCTIGGPQQLDAALEYMRSARLCELLLSLLRRLPWAQMQHERAVTHKGLALQSKLLACFAMWTRLHAQVCSSRQAAVYAQLGRRWLPQARLRKLACAEGYSSYKACEGPCWLLYLCVPSSNKCLNVQVH